jgi:hypothetical protein
MTIPTALTPPASTLQASNRIPPTISTDGQAQLPDPEIAAARAYGASAAHASGLGDWSWGDVAPLILNGWLIFHGEICTRSYVHDPRLVWPAVREGWHTATAQSC